MTNEKVNVIIYLLSMGVVLVIRFLKKLKVYITYLTTVSILATMIIYVAYKNPDLLTFYNADDEKFLKVKKLLIVLFLILVM